jgi:hypothetical protein
MLIASNLEPLELELRSGEDLAAPAEEAGGMIGIKKEKKNLPMRYFDISTS